MSREPRESDGNDISDPPDARAALAEARRLAASWPPEVRALGNVPGSNVVKAIDVMAQMNESIAQGRDGTPSMERVYRDSVALEAAIIEAVRKRDVELKREQEDAP